MSSGGLTSFLNSERNPLHRNGVLGKVAEGLPGFSVAMQRRHRRAGDEAAEQRARARDPMRSNGILAQTMERLPLVNNAIQRVHQARGEATSLQRARDHNPLRASGSLARGAEYVPLLNNVMQGLHHMAGKNEELERAKHKNPFGKSGYITKFGEHIPGLADTICCIHKFRGLDAEAERARAFSLQRMVGRQGAITQLAELLPGTNLVMAAVAEAKGDHEEAKKALNLVRQWRDVGSADGALARVAELLPGADIIAFGLMLNHGNFAQAVRAICKTRWVEVKARSSSIGLSMGCSLEDLAVTSIQSDVVIEPRAASLSSALLDVGMHLLDFDPHGRRRWQSGGSSASSSSSSSSRTKTSKRKSLKNYVGDVKLAKANEALQGGLETAFKRAPEAVEALVDLTNWAVFEWKPASRTSDIIMRALYILFPPLVCELPGPDATPSDSHLPPSAVFSLALRDSLPGVVVRHGPMPLNPKDFQIPTRAELGVEEAPNPCLKGRLPEVSCLVGCLSLQGAVLGVHSLAPVACLAGCAAGVGWAHRGVKARLASWANQVNAAVWDWMSAPVVPLSDQLDATAPGTVRRLAARGEAASSRPPPSATQPEGIIIEWPQELLEELDGASKLRDYFLQEFLARSRPLNWSHPAFWLLQFFELPLRHFLDSCLGGQAAPMVIPIPLPAGLYSDTIWLPEIRVMLILWFRFTDHRYVTGVSVALVDGLIDQIVNVAKAQMQPEDLRSLDARLADFTEPIDLKFDVALRWAAEDRLRIEFNDLSVKLGLPK
eukprot:TRINITY_DN30908_c0_g1_i1.p1 TRINITY_DN30908_c0_g1~~TRINITY_DN30908_c0_g1_i1.p1  ORF type:complete len:777 (-),score=133.74 TRINITY_DN30908_c0_g1_i1:29-2359(-)